MNVFFSLPFTRNRGPDGKFLPDRRSFYETIVETLREEGCIVFSPVTNEDWGSVSLSIREFTEFDIASILNSSALIVVASERIGRDIYLEIGIALGHRIPVGVFVPSSERSRFTYMLDGLLELGLVHVETYEQEIHAPAQVREFVQRVGKHNTIVTPVRGI
jgi:hypothetical protein